MKNGICHRYGEKKEVEKKQTNKQTNKQKMKKKKNMDSLTTSTIYANRSTVSTFCTEMFNVIHTI